MKCFCWMSEVLSAVEQFICKPQALLQEWYQSRTGDILVVCARIPLYFLQAAYLEDTFSQLITFQMAFK